MTSASDFYEVGVLHGIEIGRRQAAEERDAEWDVMRAYVRDLASRPSYATRCELAGEHRRASRAHQLNAARDASPALVGVSE